jgi:outer membrane receptor protein involved in Fe transport
MAGIRLSTLATRAPAGMVKTEHTGAPRPSFPQKAFNPDGLAFAGHPSEDRCFRKVEIVAPPIDTMTPNKHSRTGFRVSGAALLLAVSLTAAPLWAQRPATSLKDNEEKTDPNVPVEKREQTLEEKNEVLKLSPFVVQESSKDSRYHAENTLAGSRLNTNIGDLAASITVVTRQQMLDTASVDLNDVFLYEANTEGTKNFTSFSFDDQGGVRDNNQAAPASANRVRGVGSVDNAHNNYPSITGLSFDVYNTETVEINRGPNSLLFGLGSAAGTVNQSSSNANTRKDSNEVTLRYGSFDSYRTSMRLNRVLIPGKLAIFGAGLYDSRGFQRQPSFDISRRGYGAITYQPFQKTSIRATYEHLNADRRLPNTVTPQDAITEWRATGAPTWNPVTQTLTRNGVATVLPNSNFTNVPGLTNRFSSPPAMYYDNGGPLLWMQQGWTTNGLVNGTYNTNLPQFAATATTIMKLQNSTMPLFRTPGVTDRNLYDWEEINITSGVWGRRNADVFNVEVNQQIFQDLFAQVGWYREEFTTKELNYNANQPLMIDVNTHLMDGTVNPFFGKPFFSFSGNTQPQQREILNDNYRASLAYAFDFRKYDNWLKYLGLHRFFAIGDLREQDTYNRVQALAVLSNHAWQNSAARFPGAPGQITIGSTIIPRVYLGGSDGIVRHGAGYTVTESQFNIPLRHSTGLGSAMTWQNEMASLGPVYTRNSNRTKQTTESITLGVQSTFLKDKIVTTFGFRRDDNESAATTQLDIDPATGLLIESGFDRFGAPQITSGDTRTAGVVVKPLDWLSFSYGQSKNFTPAALRFDIFGKPLPLPTGEGKDYGVRFTLLDSKLVFNVNWFETAAKDARGTAADGFMFRVSRFESGFITWATIAAQNQLGAGASASAIADRVAQLTQLPLNYVPPALQVIGSTSTVDAKGLEGQIIFNPVRNWNIKATFGQQKTTFSKVAPEFDAYVGPRLPVYMSTRDHNGVLFWDALNVPDLGVPVNFWNQNIASPMSLAKALEGKRTQGQREWRASLISTYRWVEGTLKGWEVGGSLRYQDDAVIGYLGGTPDAQGVIRTLDAAKPVFDNLDPSVDVWVTKSLTLPKFLGRDIRCKLQLNVRNVLENGNWLQPIAINPDGRPNSYRIVDPREWYVNATFDF